MRIKHDEEIKLELQKILEDKSILADRIYVPSRNSIKVVFYTEGELNKVLDDKNYFIEEGYEPRLSMALKATRTVFCTEFDRALLQTYSKEKIQELLEEKGWEVRGIFIMKNKYNFKIEFKTKEIATKFLANINTEIGGIKLTQQSKEREVDPTIDQCWTCGIINPDHKNCQVLVCLKCGDGDHNFFDCRIPRKTEQRTSQQKDACYCIPCNRKGDHTSLDSFCPKKREIVQQRIQMIKNEKERENQEKQKDINLIKRVLDFSNRETWPLPGNKNQTAKYSAIISLALLDEATHPGQNKFQIKLTNGCKDNNLPTLNYRPEPKTAEIFFNAMVGANCQILNQEMGKTHNQGQKSGQTAGSLPKIKAPDASKYARDQMKRTLEDYRDMDTDDQKEFRETILQKAKKAKKKSPIKINNTHKTEPQVRLNSTLTQGTGGSGRASEQETFEDESYDPYDMHYEDYYEELDSYMIDSDRGGSKNTQPRQLTPYRASPLFKFNKLGSY